MISKAKFGALAATTKTGKPTIQQIADNGGMPNGMNSDMSRMKTTAHDYDSKRPKRQVVSRYSK